MKTETYLAASGVGLAARGCEGDGVAALLVDALFAGAGDRVLGPRGETRSALQAGRVCLALVGGE